MKSVFILNFGKYQRSLLKTLYGLKNLNDDLSSEQNSPHDQWLPEHHHYSKQFIYICPCIQNTAENIIRSYKRVQPSFQLKIIHGFTALVKVEEDQDIITSNLL